MKENQIYESNYEAALKIPISKKKEVIKNSYKQIEEHPEVATFVGDFVNSLIIEKVYLKDIFDKKEISKLKLFEPNLKTRKKHTIFEMQSIEKDLLSYHESSDLKRILPKDITKNDLNTLLDKVSNVINTNKSQT